jgi:N utilization substance protein B
MPLGPRTKVRARALQILYAWEIQGAPAVADVASGLVRIAGCVPPALEEAERLVQGVIERSAALDGHAADAADNWRIEPLGAIERNNIRIAGFELTTRTAPPNVGKNIPSYLKYNRKFPASPPLQKAPLIW